MNIENKPQETVGFRSLTEQLKQKNRANIPSPNPHGGIVEQWNVIALDMLNSQPQVPPTTNAVQEEETTDSVYVSAVMPSAANVGTPFEISWDVEIISEQVKTRHLVMQVSIKKGQSKNISIEDQDGYKWIFPNKTALSHSWTTITGGQFKAQMTIAKAGEYKFAVAMADISNDVLYNSEKEYVVTVKG